MKFAKKGKFDLKPENDIFSLGIVFILSLILEPLFDIYDFKNLKVSYSAISRYLSIIEKNYD